MLDKQKVSIIEFMTKKGKTDETKAIDKSNLAILSAEIHYSGRHVSDYELVPFEKAIKELIREGILVSTVKSNEYYLDLSKM